jgi:glutaconate CoA-transferase subunit A
MMNLDKRMDLSKAAALVADTGAVLALGGVTLYRRPMAFSLALMNRFHKQNNPGDLTLLNFTAGIESDLLLGEGMVSTVRTCYFGLEAFGLAPNFTKAAAEGGVRILEETEASLAYGLRATLAGVGFMPSIAWLGTDLPKLRPDVKTVVDPYTTEEVTAFPAIEIDVAVIHALQADPHGNARIGKNWGVDRELSLVAEHVIVTTEEVVPQLESADIIATVVEAVVETPRGAWPTSCHPNYPFDGRAILDYTNAAGTEDYHNLLNDWSARHGLTQRI